MMAHVLVTGALFKAPEQRTSKAGKPFVTATIKAKDGDSAQWWRVIAFSESAQAELMRLTDGDALSVQGGLKVEMYAKDGGEPKLSLSIIGITSWHSGSRSKKPRRANSDRQSVRHLNPKKQPPSMTPYLGETSETRLPNA
jgi:single-stranded DNA-binding protein